MIKIINNTDLFYKEIGEIIDNIQWENKKETQSEGKTMYMEIKYKRLPIKIHIKNLKNWVEWRFDVNE